MVNRNIHDLLVTNRKLYLHTSFEKSTKNIHSSFLTMEKQLEFITEFFPVKIINDTLQEKILQGQRNLHIKKIFLMQVLVLDDLIHINRYCKLVNISFY